MKRVNRKAAIVTAAAASVMGLAYSANATVIANDPMNYSPALHSLTTATDNGGDSGFSNGWTLQQAGIRDATIDSPVSMVNPVTGVTYTAAANFNGNSVSVANVLDYRTISSTLQPSTTSGSVFVSVLINNLNPTATRAFLVSLYTASATAASMGGPGAFDILDMGNEGGGVWGFDPGQAGGFLSTISTNTSSTTLLVAELDYNGGGGHDTAELFVNPNASTLQSGWTVQKTGLTLPSGAGNQVGNIRLFAGCSNGSGFGDVDYSDIVIGNQFSDVVPEPATLGLLLPAGLLAASRRYGRKRTTAQ